MDYTVKEVNESNNRNLLERLIRENTYVGRDSKDILGALKGRKGFSYEVCQGEENVGEFIESFFDGLYAIEQVKRSTLYILLMEFSNLIPVLISDLVAVDNWLIRIADYDDEHIRRIISKDSRREKMRMVLVCLNDV